MSNKKLNIAKKLKDDEFYTYYDDIENELIHYKELLKGKIIYCNCDNVEKSKFVKYFKDNFESLELQELWVSGYTEGAINSNYYTF